MPTSILVYEPDSSRDANTYADAIRREFAGLPVIATSEHREAVAAAAGATVLVAKSQDVSPELVSAMPKLDWIQALTSGVDALHALNLSPRVKITSERGIHGPQMAELAMLLMLALNRDMSRSYANQRQALWQRWPQPLLVGKTVVMVGVGTIGEALATRCHPFGLHVVGISSRAAAPGVDELYPRSRLTEIAARADFLVLLVPYAPDTHHLIDAAVLGAMKASAFLINIGRGNLVDEHALIEALRTRRIAGAGLDVFATEPLPASSPLWEMDNVIATPHIGGLSDVYAEQALPVLIHNLRAYLAGNLAAMQNRVTAPS